MMELFLGVKIEILTQFMKISLRWLLLPQTYTYNAE